MNISFNLNNNSVNIDVEPTQPLLRVLKDEFSIVSVKEGCGRGECGTCTVLLDGKAVVSCMVSIGQVRGRSVLTLEGLREEEIMIKLQEAFIDFGAVQCGFCTPGFLITAYSFLKNNSNPTRQKIREAIAGNICRCTGYTKIIDAIELGCK